MLVFSKTLNPRDYDSLKHEVDLVHKTRDALKGSTFRFEHKHRAWEYGIAIKAIKSNWDNNKPITCLDVGGGGSVFSPALVNSSLNIDVHQIDKKDWSSAINKQESLIKGKIKFEKADLGSFHKQNKNLKFDVVAAISVIEHVSEDMKFFNQLLTHVKMGGLLILTTDFHKSGQKVFRGHLKTYTERDMVEFIKIAQQQNFRPFKEIKFDYSYNRAHVYSYNFASLIMKHGSLPTT